MEKLVKLDPKTWRYIECDVVALKKASRVLRDFIIKNIPQNEDPHKIWERVVPLCEGALNDQLAVPISHSNQPLKYQIREGLLSDEFESVYAPFSIAITGSPLNKPDKIEINGEFYAYVDFEDQ